MTFGVSRGVAQDAAGNVIPNVWIEVRRMVPGFPLAIPLYADADGATGLDNPFFCASGEWEYYKVGGFDRVRVYTAGGGYDKTWDNVPVGTAQGADINGYAQAGFTWAPESATSSPPSDGCIRFNNADVSLATHIYFDKDTLGGADATNWLSAMAFQDWLLLSTGLGVEVGWKVTSITSHTSWFDVVVDASTYSGPAGPLSFGDSGFVTASQERKGVPGVSPGLTMTYSSTTTASDPGNGKFRLNNATHASATAAYIDNVEASAGASITAELDSWDDSTNTTKGFLRIVSITDPTVFRLYRVTGSVVDSTGYRTVTITYVTGNGTLSDLTSCSVAFERAGDKGTDGVTAGLRYTFDTTTTDSDPGNGKFRLNNASPGSATASYLDNVDADGATVTTTLDTWDDSSANIKGVLLVRSAATPSTFAQYSVTGSVVDGTGYRKLTLAYLAGNGSFSNSDAISVQFVRTGDDGYSPGYRLTFSTTTTDSDPGNGAIRFNNATFGSITFVYVDNQDIGGTSLTTWLDGLDDVSNANARAYLRFQKATDPSIYAEFAVTGSVVDGTGYRKIPVSPIAGAVPGNGTVLVSTAAKSGQDGSAGLPDIDRRNALLTLSGVAKALAGYQRQLDTIACGFKVSGDADGTSSGGSVDTSAGAWKPTPGGNDSFTKILLHGDGSNGSTTFTDSCAGASAHTFTAAGNAQLTTSTAKFGTAALNFDGSGDWITASDSADFTLGNGDFTVDFWFNWAGGSGVRGFLAGQGDSSGTAASSSFGLEHRTTNVIRSIVSVGAGSSVVDGTTTITATGWHHFELCRTGNTLKMFIDGTQEGGDVSITGTVNDSSNAFRVGAGGEITTTTWNGQIDEFRLSVGVARHTANFTPPTSAYSSGATNATLITPFQTADAARTKVRGTFEIDNVDSGTLGTDWTIEYTCNGGTNWSAASTYTNCGKGQSGRTIVETEEVTCTSGTSFAARVKNLNSKTVNVYKAGLKAAA